MRTVGCFIFDGLTALDIVGPYETLTGLPEVRTLVVSQHAEPIQAEGSMRIVPDCVFSAAPKLDVLVMPGGSGVNRIMEDTTWIDFLKQRAPEAQWITSVCTGALVLGAADLLRGYRATTHWLSLDLLAEFGAFPSSGRVVIDRNRITGGGVTAGIDVGLALAAKIAGETAARQKRLMLQYDPQPPFHDGSPATADPQIVRSVTEARASIQRIRREIIARIQAPAR